MVEFQRTGHFLHRLNLGVATHARYRDTHVDGWTHTRVEQVRLEENLAVGDGNHVGRDVGRYVTGLGLNQGQGRERTAAFHQVLDAVGQVVHVPRNLVRRVDFSSPLQQTAVQVEHVAGVCLASGRTTQQQRYLTVSHGLLAQVIVHHQGRTTRVAEELTNGRTRERRVELQRGRVSRRSRYHHGVIHCSTLGQRLHYLGNGRRLLADGHVNAEHGLAALEKFALVQDGIDGHGRLTGLAVADNQLALAPTNRNHGINGFDTGLHRLSHRLTEDYAGRLALQRHLVQIARNGATAVNRLAKGVHHTAHNAFSHLNGSNFVGALHCRALPDSGIVAEQYCTNVILLQVEHEALQTVLKFN